MWIILRYTGPGGLQSSLAESSFKYGLVGWLEEMARLVKSFKFSSGDLHIRKADAKTSNYLKARTRHFSVLEFQYKVLVAFKVIITAAMLIVGTLLLLDQQINIGQFVAAEIIIITIIASTEKIISNLDSVYDIMTAVEKIAKLTDKPIENGGTYSLEESEMIAINAKDLSFGYDDKPIFKDLNFDIQPGDKVCIKGRDGSGKSTLLKLLSGVYKDFKGQLLVNNVPIANYELLPLRKKMGILFQHENIFHGSLWENLTMDNPGITRRFINELCQKTGLQSFLSGLPNGYDTQLDPAGKQLPRSVVQKIMLVRALAHRPSLLILEEPFHGIEESFRHSIEKLILGIENTTVIVATADEQFAYKCNRVIHLKDTSQ